MGSVFVSHSSTDDPIVARIVADLRGLGHDVWVDQTELTAGAPLFGVIQSAIEQSDAFLLLLSEEASASPWVRTEWEAGFTRKLADDSYTFLLARLDDSEVPLFLASRKWVDVAADYDGALRVIHESLATMDTAALAKPAVWYFDDHKDSLAAFRKRHSTTFRVRTFAEIVGLMSALGQAAEDRTLAPNVILLDLYCPREGADKKSVADTEQALAVFVKAESELKGYVDAAWRPVGVEIVETVRDLYPPERLPIVMHTQEGLFLLRDELVQELEEMGAGWLLKGRFSPETDRMVIERVVLGSGHKLGDGKPRLLIIDDNPKYIQAFIERQGDYYEIVAIDNESEVLRTLNRMDAEGVFPDAFVVDMYYPRGADDAARERIDLANQKLREFSEIEGSLRNCVRESFEPLGVKALKQIRKVFSASEVPVLVYAQSGMLLLNDQSIQEIERLGSGWLLKDRYDARTEQTMILGELLRRKRHEAGASGTYASR